MVLHHILKTGLQSRVSYTHNIPSCEYKEQGSVSSTTIIVTVKSLILDCKHLAKMTAIKCMLVGDTGVGKTCLLKSSAGDRNMHGYHTLKVMIGGEPYPLDLYETSGSENRVMDRMRPLNYSETDVFLVCFSVMSPSSFKNVKKKWIPEITRHNQKKPFLLVGTQIDLRADEASLEKLADKNQKPVSVEMGENLAKKIGAAKYVECSGTSKEGLKNLIDEAILAAFEPPKNSICIYRKCVIL